MKKSLIIAGIGATMLGGGVADSTINPYTDKADRLEVVSAEQVVEVMKDRPEVRFKKWDGEVNLGVSYENVKAKSSRALLSNKIEYKGSKEEVHAYPLSDGFEIEVVLNEKPDTNEFYFTLDNWQDLDFFYQGELSQWEIDNGAVRPDNVVGSYAVYHKTKVNHKLGGTNYGTGKVGHIYRPKVIDADGNWTWAEMRIAEGLLSVTVPQYFLDNAPYPITVDPTFGNTVEQNTSFAGGNQTAGYWPVSEDGTVTSITWLYILTAGSAGDNVDFGYYNGTSGSVTTHVAHGTATANPVTTKAWHTVNVSGSVTNGTSYWLYQQQAVSSGVWNIYYDSGSASEVMAYTCNNTFDNWPDSPSCSYASSIKVSVYATYTASGGGSTPTAEEDEVIIFE